MSFSTATGNFTTYPQTSVVGENAIVRQLVEPSKYRFGGGGIVTKGGVFFIAATVYDNKVRAFDKLTGKLLWEDTMPTSSVATPSTYAINGKQYFAVSSGGGKNPKMQVSGGIIAYALP